MLIGLCGCSVDEGLMRTAAELSFWTLKLIASLDHSSVLLVAERLCPGM